MNVPRRPTRSQALRIAPLSSVVIGFHPKPPDALIGRQATRIPRKTRIRAADTPRSRSFGGDPPPLDTESHHTLGIFSLKTGTHRNSRQASRSIRSNRRTPVNNPAAGRHGTSEFPQTLPPASLFASMCGADRTVARIVVWISKTVIHLELGMGAGALLKR